MVDRRKSICMHLCKKKTNTGLAMPKWDMGYIKPKCVTGKQ